ncbi:MAG: sugar ABC transporter substrate-binding protein [Clostridiales bacterium]|nr:sugar ABC transporter substrate-binding protein [Clostridiales bacterium]
MKMKKMVAMLLMMVMCVSLLGVATAESAEKVTLTVGYWGSSGEDKAFAKAIEGIMEQFPEVGEVKLQQYPGVADFYQRLPGEIAAGTAPDIVNITNEQHLQLIDQGLVIALDDFNLDMSALSESSVNVWNYDGKQYGIPTTAAPATFAVNVDLWTAADLGEYPTTWEEVYEASKVLTKDDVVGVCLDIGNIFHPTQYMNSFGGGWNGGTTINSKENVDALTFIFKMFEEGLATTAKDAGKSWDGEVFAAGQSAMSTGGTWYVGTMSASAPDTNYTFIPMPGGDGNNGATLHSYAYAVLTGTKNEELAAKVALYMARPEYQVANAEITGGRPSDPSVMETFLELNPELAVLNDYEATATGFNYPSDLQFQTDFTSALEGVIYGGDTTTPQEILDALFEAYGN